MQLKRMRAYGRLDKTDAAPVREHVQRLVAAGMGKRRIAQVSGVSFSTIVNLVKGRGRRNGPARWVRRATAAAILAVEPRLEDMSPRAMVDATGTRRRVEALACLGWPGQRLSFMTGHAHGWAGHLRVTALVTAQDALTVRDLYERLWDQLYQPTDSHGQAARSRAVNRARKQGWAPPMAWDDDDIDNPAAQPQGVAPEGVQAA